MLFTLFESFACHGLIYNISQILKRARTFNSSGIYFERNVINQVSVSYQKLRNCIWKYLWFRVWFQYRVYVVVQFYPWFKFYFPLFWVMVSMIMSLKKRKIKFKPRIKLNHNIYNTPWLLDMIRPRDYQAVRYFTSNILAESKHKIWNLLWW